MSSQMTGLFRKLTWNDFKVKEPTSNPDNLVAQIAPGFSPSGINTQLVDGQWQMTDTVRVAVTLDASKSWVLPTVKKMSEPEKAKLLKHEQGHYDLCALLARDMFLDFMQLKSQTFSSSSDVAQAVRAIHTHYDSKAQKVEDLYDSFIQTDHGRNAGAQTKWDGFINTAFTQARVPQILTSDNKPYKIQILEVLKNNGLTVQ